MKISSPSFTGFVFNNERVFVTNGVIQSRETGTRFVTGTLYDAAAGTRELGHEMSWNGIYQTDENELHSGICVCAKDRGWRVLIIQPVIVEVATSRFPCEYKARNQCDCSSRCHHFDPSPEPPANGSGLTPT